jgi:hypothetical protein
MSNFQDFISRRAAQKRRTKLYGVGLRSTVYILYVYCKHIILYIRSGRPIFSNYKESLETLFIWSTFRTGANIEKTVVRKLSCTEQKAQSGGILLNQLSGRNPDQRIS